MYIVWFHSTPQPLSSPQFWLLAMAIVALRPSDSSGKRSSSSLQDSVPESLDVVFVWEGRFSEQTAWTFCWPKRVECFHNPNLATSGTRTIWPSGFGMESILEPPAEKSLNCKPGNKGPSRGKGPVKKGPQWSLVGSVFLLIAPSHYVQRKPSTPYVPFWNNTNIGTGLLLKEHPTGKE